MNDPLVASNPAGPDYVGGLYAVLVDDASTKGRLMIGLFANALFSRLWGAASGALGLARKYPMQALCIALAGLSACLWWGWDREQAAHRNTQAIMAEMVAASKRQIAANERFLEASKDIAHATDKQDTDLRIVFRDRVLRIPPASRQCPAAENNVPEGADGPSGDTILFPRSDALICATNTSRLIAAHDWAIALEQLQEAPVSAIP